MSGVEVTKKAADTIKEYLKSQEAVSAIRIITQIGWGAPVLALALDEPKENDFIFTEQDITFAIDKELLEEAKPIRLDYVEAGERSGFQFTSSLPVGDCGCSWKARKYEENRY